MRYKLYYWPTIQGRGEFVRLTFEAAGADYVDVARMPENRGMGVPAMMKLMQGKGRRAPLAPPFVKAGDEVVAQVANILAWLGPSLGLAPPDDAGRRWAHQLQLTVTDFVHEVHDTHHPIAGHLYYEDQKREAKKRAAAFLEYRLPKYLGYFEQVLARNGGAHMAGAALTTVDLSMFQLIAGMRYGFPRAMANFESKIPRLASLHDTVAALPRVAAYLASKRRIAFNEHGIFRRYPELDT